jgi:hypothetical protein
MAELVAEHKTEMLNKDQGQIKVMMRQMTPHKPSGVSSFCSQKNLKPLSSSSQRVVNGSIKLEFKSGNISN